MVQYSVMVESKDLFRNKDHWMYGLDNSDTYCTKKKDIESYQENNLSIVGANC